MRFVNITNDDDGDLSYKAHSIEGGVCSHQVDEQLDCTYNLWADMMAVQVKTINLLLSLLLKLNIVYNKHHNVKCSLQPQLRSNSVL